MTTGAVFCSVPNREQWSIELSQARKAHLLTDILKGERISSETEILASFSPLVPPFSSAACAVATSLHPSSPPHPHAAWCATKVTLQGRSQEGRDLRLLI